MVILQLAVLFTFLAAGELVVWLTGVLMPSSIIGMLLLTLALKLRIVRLRHVEGVADFLVSNLGFFFVLRVWLSWAVSIWSRGSGEPS